MVRAPWLTQGYLKSPEASAQLWAGGYLHTNDIGKIDTDGHLTITDRLKDVIKTGGEWISSLELEDIIAQHHLVGEAPDVLLHLIKSEGVTFLSRSLRRPPERGGRP